MKECLFLSLLCGCGQLAPPADAAAPEAGINDGGDGDVAAVSDAAADVVSDSGGACTYLLSSLPCNSLPEGALIDAGCTSSPPTPQGGPLVDGLYNLVQVDWDTTATDAGCPSGLTRRGTIEICGGTLLWLDYDEVSSVWRGDTSIAVNGNAISFQEFCSGNESWSFNYTSSGTTLVVFWQYPQGERLIMTFTRQ